jgi:hypothetical protein
VPTVSAVEAVRDLVTVPVARVSQISPAIIKRCEAIYGSAK